MVFACSLVVAGCGENLGSADDSERVSELEAALEAERAESSALREQIGYIHAELGPDDPEPTPTPSPSPTPDPTPEPQPPAPPPCPSNLYTFVKHSAGNTCGTYKAWVKGWSEKCVTNCNQATRLAEATASADATCKKFCSDKNCSAHRYSPPAQCATGSCTANSSMCPAQCKSYDTCYLEQGNVRWNCWCDVVVQP